MYQIPYRYHNKSVPEFVMMTWLGRDVRDKLIACEGKGKDGFDYCNVCRIQGYCFMRLNDLFSGYSIREVDSG